MIISNYCFYNNVLQLFALFTVLTFGCVPTEEEPDLDQTGHLILSIQNSDEVSEVKNGRIRVVTPIEDYSVSIFNSSDVLVESFENFSDVPAAIELPVGSYYATAHSENLVDAAFDNPYYYGESELVNVLQGGSASLEITCKLANAMVSFRYTEELVNSFDTWETNVVFDGGSLLFSQDETRPGYFDIKTLNFTTSLTAGGIPQQVTGSIEPLPRTHYIVTIQASLNNLGSTVSIFIDEFVDVEHLFFDEDGPAQIVDGSGNTYNAITIGTQDWLLENLKTTKFNDGTDIPEVTSSVTWSNLATPGFSWYGNDSNNGQIYGGLYNGYAASSGNICPVGWHVPTADELDVLTNFLGGPGIASKLKETGTAHWDSPNVATNESGFTALPGGRRDNSGDFSLLGAFGYWHRIDEVSLSGKFWITHSGEFVMRGGTGNNYGASIRCIRD